MAHEFCAICREVFDDPVVCGDGYCYCRQCISAWVANKREWRSPCTNERICGAALLTPDRLRACVAREYRREMLKSLGWTPLVTSVAVARFGADPLATPEECARVARDPRLSRILRWGASGAHTYLEICWRAGDVDRFPRALVGSLCMSDRHGPYPFVQRGVLAALLRSCARSYQTDRCALNETATVILKVHYEWRLAQADGIFVSPEKRGPIYGGLYYRAPLQDAMHSRWLQFQTVAGAEMRVPLLNLVEACANEQDDTTISRDGSLAFFTSRLPVALKGPALLAARRAPAPSVFPDSTGVAEIVDSSDSDSDSDSDDEEGSREAAAADVPVGQERDGTSTEACPPEESPGTCGRAAATLLKEAQLCIWERPVASVPRGFEYVPRVRGEDELKDTEQHVASANAALVTGLLAKRAVEEDAPARQRRVRPRTL